MTQFPRGDGASQPTQVSQRRRRTPVSAAEQARRVAWGREAGAKVAAEYRQLQEAAKP